MPTRVCDRCGGKGTCLEMGEETCINCSGTGRDFREEFWASPCRICNGRGKVTYCRSRTCTRCYGSGQILY